MRPALLLSCVDIATRSAPRGWRLALLALLLVSAACGTATSPGAGGVDVVGATDSAVGSTDAAQPGDGAAGTDALAQTDAAASDAQATTDVAGQSDDAAQPEDTAQADATADSDSAAEPDGGGGSDTGADAGADTDAATGSDASASQCAGAANNTPCDDGNPCTKGDLCTAGTCAGAALDCDDNNACTSDTCKDGSCSHAPLGLPGPPAGCDDGNPCTLGDGCQAGSCVSGEVVCECTKTADCAAFEDGNACNGTLFCNLGTGKCQVAPNTVVVCDSSADTACSQNTCVPASGDCTAVAAQDGSACTDGDACTTGDACKDGQCASGTNTCLCTQDSDCASKEDGNLCNGTLFCNKQTGQCDLNPATVVTCPSANDTECQKNLCNAATGQCAMTDLTGSCDDGNACTSGEACSSGTCQGGSVVCECQADTDCAAKEDGNACNGKLYCDLTSNTCKVNPATIVNCPTAGNTICSQLTCQPASGQCVWQNANDGTGCDADGTGCTPTDTCQAGQCVADDNVCICQTSSDCAQHDDANLCNGSLYCDKTTNTCKVNPATVVVCPKGDDTACLANTCDPQWGTCALTPVREGEACDADGNACTSNDVCVQGSCALQANTCICQTDADCGQHEDGNLCNGTLYCDQVSNTCQVNPATIVTCPSVADTDCEQNRCQPLTGSCEMTAVFDFTPCEADGTPCTLNDYCEAGSCKAGKNLCACQIDSNCDEFDDANLCTGVYYCDKSGAAGACALVPNSVVICPDPSGPCSAPACTPWTGQCEDWGKGGQSCDDGSPCTVMDFCMDTVCQGTAVVCDDNDPCTGDSCDGNSGQCQHNPLKQGLLCDDGNPCLADTTCQNGACSGGVPLDCDDNEPCTNDSCEADKGGCVHTLVAACTPNAKLPYWNSFDCGLDPLWAISMDSDGANLTEPALNWQVAEPAAGGWGGCALMGAPSGDLANCKDTDVRYVTSPLLDASGLVQADDLRVQFQLSGTWNAAVTPVVLQAAKQGEAFAQVAELQPPGGGWQVQSIALGSYAGSKFQLRFVFSLNQCASAVGSGPLIDDVDIQFKQCATEADCDDNNPCTAEVCQAASKTCKITPLTAPPPSYACEATACGARTAVCVDGQPACIPAAPDPAKDGTPCGQESGPVCQGGQCVTHGPATASQLTKPQRLTGGQPLAVSVVIADPANGPYYSDIASVQLDLSATDWPVGPSVYLAESATSVTGKERTYTTNVTTTATPGVFVLPLTITEKDGRSWQIATWVVVLPGSYVTVGLGQQFASLDSAIAASPAGSTYLIAPGAYQGKGWTNLNLAGVTAIADPGAAPVVIDCGMTGRMGRLINDGSATAGFVLAGVTISNCSAGAIQLTGGIAAAPQLTGRLVGVTLQDNQRGDHGGAVAVYGPHNHLLAQLTTWNNNSVAGYRGGALSVADGASADIRWSSFEANRSDPGPGGLGNTGGAISVYGSGSNATIAYTTFSDNASGSGPQGEYGGDAINAQNATLTLQGVQLTDHDLDAVYVNGTNTTIRHTTFGTCGGSASLTAYAAALLVEDCLFHDGVGGIAASYGTLTLRRTRLHNHTYYQALYLNWPTSALIEDVEVDHNQMLGTGTVYLAGEVTLRRLNLHDNSTIGGALYAGGSVVIEDSELRGNVGNSGQGGAISASGDLTLRGSVVAHNSTSGYGGAIYHLAGLSGGTMPNGGGLRIENCLFHHNQAGEDGGAIYEALSGGGLPGPVIHGSTLAANTAKRGGGIWLDVGSDTQLRDSILWGNQATTALGHDIALRNDAAVAASIERCLIWDGSGFVHDPALTINGGNGYSAGILGNLAADPLFVGSGPDPYLLSQLMSGQFANSPAVEPAGGQAAGLMWWGARTTRTDGQPDGGLLDYGWHAPLPE